MGHTAGLNRHFERDRNLYRISGYGYSSIHQYGRCAYFHSGGGMAWCAYTSVYYHRHIALLYDYLQEFKRFQTHIAADRRTQWHDGSYTHFFQPFAKNRVGMYVRQYYEAVF